MRVLGLLIRLGDGISGSVEGFGCIKGYWVWGLGAQCGWALNPKPALGVSRSRIWGFGGTRGEGLCKSSTTAT